MLMYTSVEFIFVYAEAKPRLVGPHKNAQAHSLCTLRFVRIQNCYLCDIFQQLFMDAIKANVFFVLSLYISFNDDNYKHFLLCCVNKILYFISTINVFKYMRNNLNVVVTYTKTNRRSAKMMQFKKKILFI